MINHNNSVGKRIKDAREKARLTQSQLARMLGYSSPTAISLIEDDQRSVKVEMLEKFAKALKADLNFLATGEKAAQSSYKTALRADKSFSPDDLDRIEDFIEFIVQKKNRDGRGTEK